MSKQPIGALPNGRATALSLAVPAYFHPAVAPKAWRLLAALASHLRFVVVNVHNGPGEWLDPSYPPAIAALKEAGILVVGYVDTGYGSRSPAEVGRDFSTFHSRYGVEGVFLDQVSTGLDQLEHYSQCVVVARTHGARFVVLNPGTHPHPGYVDLANTTVTFEGTWDQYTDECVPDWVRSYSAKRFTHLVHSLPPESFTAGLKLARQRHVSSIFLTGSRGANPWDHVPAGLTNALQNPASTL